MLLENPIPLDPQFWSSLFHASEGTPSISAPILGYIGTFAFATSTITIMFLTVVFIMLCMIITRAKMIPNTFQNLAELLYEQIVRFISSIIGNRDRAKQIVPYVGAVLVYLLVSNLLFFIPFLSGFYVNIDGIEAPLFRGNTTDFNTTFGLALAIMVMIQAVSIREQGFLNYLDNFIRIRDVLIGFQKGLKEGFASLVSFFIGLIEIISELAKILSLSLRLFGNMFAHEVLAVILLGSFAFVLPSLWMGLGLLVAVVQAVVFVALVSVYYAMAFKKELKNKEL